MRVAITLLAGVALGLFSHESSSLPGAWRWVGNFGALWLLVSFFVGRWVGQVRLGAAAGAVTLALASVVHYVPYRMARDGISWGAFRWPVALWVFVGIVLGGVFGGLGAQHWEGRHLGLLGVAMLVAAFVGESFVLLRTGHSKAVEVAVPIELAVAAFLPFVATKSWMQRGLIVAGSVVLVPLAVYGLSAFMGLISRVYPGI